MTSKMDNVRNSENMDVVHQISSLVLQLARQILVVASVDVLYHGLNNLWSLF